MSSKISGGTNDRNSRRGFLQSAGASTLALLASTTKRSTAWAASGSDKIRLGFIGLGGRGRGLLSGFMGRPDCQVVALCEVHRERLHQAQSEVVSAHGEEPVVTSKLEELLNDNSIDAVVIATPDHWHSPATVYACQAGKHVYVEKPISNNVWEGAKAVEAARTFDRVVQSGMQNRSAVYNFKARDYIQSGKLGKILLCNVFNQKALTDFSMAVDSSPPDFLDWERWNGPCPTTQFNSTRYGHWHQFWDYGGGEVTNDGVHQLDLACMVLGIETLPGSVYTIGNRRPSIAAETPDTIVTTFDFDEFPLTFHQTLEANYMLKSDPGIRNGDLFPYWPQNATRIEIFGTKGVMFLGRHGGGWQVFDRPRGRKPVIVAQEFGRFPDPEHKDDFLQAIRDGRRPNADIEHGHRSASLCHLINISYRAGNVFLEIDPSSGRIANNDQANALLKSEYREPYTIANQF